MVVNTFTFTAAAKDSGSADNKKYDYALIFFEPENYLPIGMKLEDAAYAEPLSLFRGNFKFYSKSGNAA